MTAADVMDRAAVLLNDSAKNVYTYAAQLPYLQTAYDELGLIVQTNNIPISNETSAALTVLTGTTTIGASTTPALPTDLVEIQSISERISGSTDPYIDMVKTEFLPKLTTLTNELTWWAWQGQEIKFLGANSDRQISIDYISTGLSAITTSSSSINMLESKLFLSYRTAALCCMYIGENPTRASALSSDAETAKDMLINLSIKGMQAIPTRRRPFMAGYKGRTNW